MGDQATVMEKRQWKGATKTATSDYRSEKWCKITA